jgi:hypothetical protein
MRYSYIQEKKTRVLRIPRQASAVQIAKDKKKTNEKYGIFQLFW